MTSFVGIRELSNNTKKTLYRLRKNGSLIVTEHGKPIAVMLPIDDGDYSFDCAYDFIDNYEKHSTLYHVAEFEKDNPNRPLTMKDIDEEIAKVRKEIRKEFERKQRKNK